MRTKHSTESNAPPALVFESGTAIRERVRVLNELGDNYRQAHRAGLQQCADGRRELMKRHPTTSLARLDHGIQLACLQTALHALISNAQEKVRQLRLDHSLVVEPDEAAA